MLHCSVVSRQTCYVSLGIDHFSDCKRDIGVHNVQRSSSNVTALLQRDFIQIRLNFNSTTQGDASALGIYVS